VRFFDPGSDQAHRGSLVIRYIPSSRMKHRPRFAWLNRGLLRYSGRTGSRKRVNEALRLIDESGIAPLERAHPHSKLPHRKTATRARYLESLIL
jgi:hypothetical protein